jgi:hypothetical protein
MAKKPMPFKTAEKKYEDSPSDKKADKAGAKKLQAKAKGKK